MTEALTIWYPIPEGEAANTNVGAVRITEDDDTRITESGDTRILEDNVITAPAATVWVVNDP